MFAYDVHMFAYDVHANLDVECSQCFSSSALAAVGLVIIALGTGGIKPCVSAFGGDQFKDDQVRTYGAWLCVQVAEYTIILS